MRLAALVLALALPASLHAQFRFPSGTSQRSASTPSSACRSTTNMTVLSPLQRSEAMAIADDLNDLAAAITRRWLTARNSVAPVTAAPVIVHFKLLASGEIRNVALAAPALGSASLSRAALEAVRGVTTSSVWTFHDHAIDLEYCAQ